ncbi:35828_t:CDS:10, partial [Gigaspora margarita]
HDNIESGSFYSILVAPTFIEDEFVFESENWLLKREKEIEKEFSLEDIIKRDKELDNLIKRAKAKKVKHKPFSYQKLAKLVHATEMDNAYNANCYNKNKEIIEGLYKRDKKERIENNKNDYKKLIQEVLNVFNTLSKEVVQKKEETIGMNDMLELENLVLDGIENILIEEELKENKNLMFESTKYLEINKTKVKKERSIGEKDKVDNSKNFTAMDDCEVFNRFDQKKKEKIETIPMESGELIIEEYSHLIVHLDDPQGTREKELDVTYQNQDYVIPIPKFSMEPGPTVTKVLNACCNLDEPVEEPSTMPSAKKVKEFQRTVTWNIKEIEANSHEAVDHYQESAGKAFRILEWSWKSAEVNNSNSKTRFERNGKSEIAIKENKIEVDEPTRGEHTGRTFNVDNINRVFEVGYKVKNKDGRVEIKLLLTYPKLAKMDCANKIEDPEDVKYVDETVELNYKDKLTTKVEFVKDKNRWHYQNKSRIKTYGWQFGSAKGANSAGKFDPGGFHWQRPLLRKVKEINVGMELLLTYLAEDGCPDTKDHIDVDVRLIDIKLIAMDEFESKSIWTKDQLQGSMGGSVAKMPEVGNIKKDGKHINVTKTIDNEMDTPLFDPGG